MFRHADVVCLCASCGSSQCCILHDLQFVNAVRGCKSVSFCLLHPVALSVFFIICRGLYACTEMFMLRSRLLVYTAWSGVNRVQVVLSEFSVR